MIYTILESFCSFLKWEGVVIWPKVRPRKILVTDQTCPTVYREMTLCRICIASGKVSQCDTFSVTCYSFISLTISAVTCDFQQGGILTSVDSDKPVQPPFKLRNSKLCSVSSLSLIKYSSDYIVVKALIRLRVCAD